MKIPFREESIRVIGITFRSCGVYVEGLGIVYFGGVMYND